LSYEDSESTAEEDSDSSDSEVELPAEAEVADLEIVVPELSIDMEEFDSFANLISLQTDVETTTEKSALYYVGIGAVGSAAVIAGLLFAGKKNSETRSVDEFLLKSNP
jgi:hypothetical protein